MLNLNPNWPLSQILGQGSVVFRSIFAPGGIILVLPLSIERLSNAGKGNPSLTVPVWLLSRVDSLTLYALFHFTFSCGRGPGLLPVLLVGSSTRSAERLP